MKRFVLYVFFSFFCCVITFAQQSEWRDLIENKQFEKVILQAENLQPADSADFFKAYILGQAYEGLLKYKEAYDYYKHCYTLDSTRIDMLNTLARISGNLGRMKEAEKYYKQVVEYDSTNFYANYQLARLYVQSGNYEEGLKYYDYLLERDAENTILLRAIGDCYVNMDSMHIALDYYKKAFYNNMENASLASTLINTLLNLYDPELNFYAMEAFFICDTALSYNPENITLRQKEGLLYFMHTDYKKADSVYTSLMADRDSSFITLKYCGLSRFYSQSWYDAIEPFEKALEKEPKSSDICILLGISLGRTYDVMKSFEYFDEAERLMAPDDYWVVFLAQFRAEMYAKIGDCDKSAEFYYQLWNREKKQLSGIIRPISCYSGQRNLPDIADDKKQKLLFLCFLYASEVSDIENVTENTERDVNISYVRSILIKFQEEMFFRGMKNYTMVSPDKKNSIMSEEKLKELIKKLSKE